MACKLVVYENEPDEYMTFITPEGYKVIQDYIQFRKLYGETVGPSSPLLRDLFCTTGNPLNYLEQMVQEQMIFRYQDPSGIVTYSSNPIVREKVLF